MILRLLFLFFTVAGPILAIKWLAIHQVSPPWTDFSDCPMNRTERKQFGLVTYQSRLCRRAPHFMPVIIKAAKQAIDTCQKTFGDNRWNCSSILFAPNLKADLSKGTREASFVHALSAAAIVHAVAKSCVTGDLPCPCGYAETTMTPGSVYDPVLYKWKGCSDNVDYGRRISREWADAMWKRSPITFTMRKRKSVLEFDPESLNEEPVPQKLGFKARMNQNNNDIGRKIAQQSQFRKCKCHGVSSSCDIKTCWNTLPSLQVIADSIKDRYFSAYQIGQPYDITGSKNDGRSARIPLNNKDELIFVRSSPNYCDENLELGSFGTKDRECKHSNVTGSTTNDHSDCQNLCCGRGFNTQAFTIEEQCMCKYVHCCYVKCKKCKRTIEKHYCK